MADCTLIFPNQLFDPHPAVTKERAVALIEDGLFFGDPHVGIKFHQQKVVLHRASMKTFAAELKRRGHDVAYRDFTKGKTVHDHLLALRDSGFDNFHFCDPVDYLLTRRLERAAKKLRVKLQTYDSPMFLTPDEELEREFGGEKRPFMARFYERQRKRMGILVDADGSPLGGKWSFDDQNRKPMPKSGLDVPPDPTAHATKFSKGAITYVETHFANYHGSASGFNYPVSHASAERWLDKFLAARFRLFGDYEDAISKNERVLFHGVLTPMLNIGLLTPDKILDRALEFAGEHDVPINSVEGLIRQVIGWREFVRGAYIHLGVTSRNRNFWDFEDRAIPRAFYEATTGIPPVDTAIRRALDHGYCHHIERLMVLGNFMLLCGFHPHRVYDWFMELFVDAYDWVMVPNAYGMSQFADGGLFTTKPYISGSNYIRKMGDFERGQWCDVWDGLFWTFIDSHRDFFRSQHRLSMMVKNLERMPSEKREQHSENASSFLSSLT